jgi:transposase
VRKCLFEATLSAARFNPGIRAIYRRLKDEGKPDKVARIAAARKLLLLAHAIYESGEALRTPAKEVTRHAIQHLALCLSPRSAVND